MTLTLEVNEETRQAIEDAAAKLGVPVETFAADVLRQGLNDWLLHHNERPGPPMSFEEALAASASDNAELLKRLA